MNRARAEGGARAAVGLGSTAPGQRRGPARLSPRRAVWIVVAAAAVVRLLALGSNPLIVTWDGMHYLGVALTLLEEGRIRTFPFRTPGYPLLLAAVFAACGASPVAVLAAQHAIGVGMSGLLAWTGARLGGAWAGLVVGLLGALDPWLVAMESHAMAESATVGTMVLMAALVLGAGSARPAAAGLLGATMAYACLLRPAMQVVVPFVALAWMARVALGGDGRARWRAAALHGGLVAVAFAAVAGPWLVYNASRGVLGLARGTELASWYGAARSGIINEPPAAADERARGAFARHVRAGEPNGMPETWAFLNEVGALTSAETARLLRAWWWSAVRERPGAYARAVGHAVLWQLNIRLASSPVQDEGLAWWTQRFRWDARLAGQGAPNFNAGGDVSRFAPFTMHASRGGVVSAFYRWWGRVDPEGWPQAPLLAAAVVAAGLAAARREWALVLLLAGTFALVIAHALMLLPASRYSNPAWAVWYLAPAYLAGRAAGAGRAPAALAGGAAAGPVVRAPGSPPAA